jgi:hypothetical protein
MAGPLGPRPIERVIRANLSLFMQLRAAGASWPQIAAELQKHGVRTRAGALLSADQLRAMISRAARRSQRPGSPLKVPAAPRALTAGVHTPARAELPDPQRDDPRVAEIRERMRRSAAARDDRQ